MSTQVFVKNVKHTCGGPKFGRLAPVGECPRCDQLHEGAPARAGWSDGKRRAEASFLREVKNHDCKARGCGPVCTFGEW